jgi:DNA-binding NtrC family response regulator
MPQPPAHILVVDNKSMTEFLDLLLRDEGYTVQCVNSTERAIAVLRTAPPDLVISDLRIWGIPPMALMALTRATSARAAIQTIICTGAIIEAEACTADLAREGMELICKPFDIDDLLDAVRRGCGRVGPTEPA